MRHILQHSRPITRGNAEFAARSTRSVFLGNQATLRRLAMPNLQAKLAIGAVNDPLEHEADRVANHVMRMPAPGLLTPATSLRLSRECAACEDEDTVHRRQTKPHPALNEAVNDEAPGIVHEVLRSPGQPLDTTSRAFFQPRFGYDFSHVRVHAGPQAARSAQAVGAIAYTVANHVVFGTDSKLHSPSNAILAHELAHVIQQGGASPRGGDAAGGAVQTVGRQDVSTGATPQVHRQADEALDLNMPAFPCEKEGGIMLCNTTKDSNGAPNLSDCMQNSKDIIDDCKGDKSECLSRSKCALCECLGKRYCQCTGIV